MAKHIIDPDDKTVRVYSDAGDFLWSYNPNYPDIRFDIQTEKTICGYKFIVTDHGCSFVYVGSDD